MDLLMQLKRATLQEFVKETFYKSQTENPITKKEIPENKQEDMYGD